ncbi:hypothetical protein JYU34_000927 [Plutella xylostella]|uniref:Uncharacterized protein n=1 Tax=Plutella xylostella TaxID=51655 RepID=A0ABQ7R5P0_PLUXY|nr:hypothetical protein JYU34_000927 [Plutella xylostella]
MLRLLSILTRRRRDPARALAAQQQCTMRDSCRCDDCQLVNIAYLLSILTRRRRDPARALAAQQQCTMRDSCRCDDCQVSNTIRYRRVSY